MGLRVITLYNSCLYKVFQVQLYYNRVIVVFHIPDISSIYLKSICLSDIVRRNCDLSVEMKCGLCGVEIEKK